MRWLQFLVGERLVCDSFGSITQTILALRTTQRQWGWSRVGMGSRTSPSCTTRRRKRESGIMNTAKHIYTCGRLRANPKELGASGISRNEVLFHAPMMRQSSKCC